VGNDISSRKLQRDPKLAGGVPQWGFSKGFDTYAPLGPVLVAQRLIPRPETLRLQTRIDGVLRQDTGVDDLVFNIPYIISYLSKGTTLEKGSVIMTGTPGGERLMIPFAFNYILDPENSQLITISKLGVGAGLDPAQYLVPGTKMEVYVSSIGTLRNGVEFA
jgi:2-keto-4-pentenoate hydratase/2-oxohepta-3-ene-1,7-dioic acid hydratase in catechol pathway